MFVSHLSLTDFRSYSNLELSFKPGQNIFIGENGEGKTNIIESLMYLALLSSHRISSDQPLVKLGAERAYVRAKVESEERTTLVELEINASKANRAKVNQNPVRSQKELVGIAKSICFSPEDLRFSRKPNCCGVGPGGKYITVQDDSGVIRSLSEAKIIKLRKQA